MMAISDCVTSAHLVMTSLIMSMTSATAAEFVGKVKLDYFYARQQELL